MSVEQKETSTYASLRSWMSWISTWTLECPLAQFLQRYLQRWKSSWLTWTRSERERSRAENWALSDLTEEEIDRAVDTIGVAPADNPIGTGPQSPFKGLGICDSPSCEKYRKGAFIYMHTGAYHCYDCHQVGYVVPERGVRIGLPGRIYGGIHVHYKYDAVTREYTQTAIIRDQSLGEDANTYLYYAPMIYTEKKALQSGEILLSLLNQDLSIGDNEYEIPYLQETILSFDEPLEDFMRRLKKWSHVVRRNKLLSREIVSQSSAERSNLRGGIR